MPLRNTPIQRKLMTILLLTSGVVLLLTCVGFIVYEVITVRRGMVMGVTTRGEIIAANCSGALAFQNPADATEVLAALKYDHRMVAACLYDQAGQIFATYPANAAREVFPTTPGVPGSQFGSSHLVVWTDVTQGGRVLGMIYLKSDLTALTDRYRAYVWLVLVIIPVSFLVAYLISKVLQKQISRPILALAETARAVSDRHDYSVRAARFGDDELGALTTAFNQMLAQIQKQNQALSESEMGLRAVLNSALSAVVAMDVQGKIVDWNARAETMFGWSRSEAIGRDLAETIIPPQHVAAHRRGMAHYQKTGEGPVLNRTIELTALHRDGKEFPVELSISPLKIGDTVRFCGFVTDITERQATARREAVFARVGQNLSAAVSAAAAARIVVAAADELLGWDACSLNAYDAKQDLVFPIHYVDTIDGQRVDVTAPPGGAPPSALTRRVLEHGAQLILRESPSEPLPEAVPFGKTDQASASLLFVPIHRGEQIIGILSVQSYTTGAYDQHGLNLLQTLADQCGGALERVRAEDALRQLNEELERRVSDRTAQLEAANQELEAFSYSVSHDLRAPLRHVSGFAEMLRQETGDTLSPDGQKYLKLMSEAARRMGTLIDDLLVFSRMGRTSLRRSNVDMNELVADVLREMAADFQNRDIHWIIAPMPELSVDRALFKQVWVNLISNAVKYTRQRARAEIQIQCRRTDGGRWEFSVRDNGAGFDMQYADKLFGVFQRLHHAEEFEGTGIGLANVRRVILRHGGQTWAEGRVGEGATFYFSVPMNEEKRHETQTYSAGRRQPE